MILLILIKLGLPFLFGILTHMGWVHVKTRIHTRATEYALKSQQKVLLAETSAIDLIEELSKRDEVLK